MPVALITGTSTGIGLETALLFARKGYKVYAGARTPASSEGLQRALADGLPIVPLALDVDSDGSVRDAMERVEPVDVLVNNAGIGSGLPDLRTRQSSVDGYELRFAVNHLAGLLLTLELLPLLRASAPARVVNVASLGQHPLDFDDLMLERGYSGSRAYAQSKLAQIMAGFELAERVPAGEITVNSLHPGTYMPTKIVVENGGSVVDSLATGVAATRRLVADPALASTTGAFYDRTREAAAHPQAYDDRARAELWRRSLRLIGRSDVA
jgi:NAD(P)-dependent dehydrogenase (short-subunit alcohol dehydrogenase family)